MLFNSRQFVMGNYRAFIYNAYLHLTYFFYSMFYSNILLSLIKDILYYNICITTPSQSNQVFCLKVIFDGCKKRIFAISFGNKLYL